ncbi:carbohydrate-binding domain-containing protein [Marinomonas transparens]|uniref:Carbohydrate binding module xylan-binding domain-containing protein n=1 Tax=Marinomonas transparens TaxID=2795388 RepID=A0A934N0R3_9GAMM|nr:carbohydrate-binding domain-containing protein [Marinomonas transparens]MBJ7538810.1 hypothetical protein [Marinomonas transparens]
MLSGFSANAQAGIFDDIADVFDDIIDQIENLFSSAGNVAESVVEKIDTTVIANITGRCTTVKADDDSGNSETTNVVEQCGHSIVELKDVFEDLGGEIAEQAQAVENSLGEIAQEEWEDATEPFTNASKEVVAFLGDTSFNAVKGVTTDLLTAMQDPKTTLANIPIPLDEFASTTDLDLTYTIPLGAAALELGLRGAGTKTIGQDGVNFVGLTGKLFVRLRTVAGLGYTPMAWAQITYANPIIKIEDDRITGIFVMQPNGSISLSAVGLPLQFSASLEQLVKAPGLQKITVLQKLAQAVSFDADVGTVAISFPLTNQTDTRFNFDLEISAGVDAIVNIFGGWNVKILERVSWSRNFTLDVPPLQLPLSSIPAGLLGELEANSEASYAEKIASYTFDDSGSNLIEDMSGYGNHATLVGGVTLQDGAAYLNGNDGYIDLPDNLMANADAITIYSEIYINEEQASPYFIYGLGNSNGDWGDGYLFTTGDIYRSALSNCNWTCEESTFEERLKVPRGSWQQLVYTVEDNVATTYLNGDIVSQNTNITIKPSDIGNGNTAANYIGRSLYSNDHYFNGAVRHFEIWNGALTHDEIISKFGDTNTITVRARGTNGSEQVSLIIGGSTIDTWTMSTSMQDYRVNTSVRGDIRVAFLNDGGDVQVDYISVNGQVRQSEDQDDNTGVWGNGSCGGGTYSDWLHCIGSIGYGTVLDQSTITVNARGTTGSEQVSLTIGGSTIQTWTLSTSMQDYTVTTPERGEVRVAFINDNDGDRDVQVDFIRVDGQVRQAEDQDDNTGVWGNDSCGGGTYSDWLNCNGSIGFGSN